MMRVVLSIGVLALVCIASVADARRHRAAVVPICNNLDIVNPCPGYMEPGVFKMFGVPPKAEIHTRIPRARAHRRKRAVAKSAPSGNLYIDGGSTSWGAVARPMRYIAGRLTCALNVGAALAERGIKGTGSAMAHSYDHWGIRVPSPVVGAVAVTDRRGGGHVAIVSRVEGGRVFVFNPGRHGWREREYTHRHARYRVAG